jgi:hypothetical protein
MNDLKVTPEFVGQLRDDVMAMYATAAMRNRLRALILDWQNMRSALEAIADDRCYCGENPIKGLGPCARCIAQKAINE